jgi:pantothenate kinase
MASTASEGPAVSGASAVPGSASTAAARDSLDALIAAAERMVSPGRRRILGITGAPGAGKSTLSEALVAALAPQAVLVSMDGFHLCNTELRRLGRFERKGAIDTFDAAGYLHLLKRLQSREEDVVYAPRFDRALEESIGSAIPVPAEVPLIVTEGNYLLADGPSWSQIRSLLDECWYVEPGEERRLNRLMARHVEFGRSPGEAYERSHGPDGRNAELIRSTKPRATRVVEVPELPGLPLPEKP